MKLVLDKNNKLDLTIMELSKLIKGTKFENNIYAVGGYVKDKLLGLKPNDIDIVVSMPNGGIEFAEWVCKETDCYKENSNPVIFPRFSTSKFNIRSIKEIADVDIECVHTRKEVYVDENSRKPDTEYGTILEDALRRDLTINALYLNIGTLEVTDPTKMGLDDIKNHILRTPTDPNKTYFEDPLRMLRLIRFSTKYGYGIEKTTWFGLINNAYRIRTISQERITEELKKIIVCDKPSIGFKKMRFGGLLKYVMSDLHKLIGCEQNDKHFGDAFEHTMATIDKTKPIIENRFAALLHDIAKPESRVVNETGVHFYGHEYRSALLANSILKEMKFSNAEIKPIMIAVKNHMRFKQSGNHCPSNKSLRKFISDVGGENVDIVLDVIDADNKSHKDEYNINDQVDLIRDKLNELAEKEKEIDLNKLPINGNDIMNEFKLKASPIIGQMLNIVKEKFIDNPSITKEECLEAVRLNLTV